MFLKSIEIRDLRSIKQLRLDFSTDDKKLRKWTLLLGENGCGKSTALRAIALLLAGSDSLAELLKEPDRWIRNKKEQASITGVLLNQAGETRQISLILRRGLNIRETLKYNEEGLSELDAALKYTERNYFVMGYGVTRRPSMSAKEFSQISERGLTHERARSLATMFAPEATLVSFEQWAMDIEYRGGDSAVSVLRSAMSKLLPGMRFEGIDRKRRELIFKTADGNVPFQQLSDGYQNMANLCGDILYRITQVFEDYRSPLKTRGLLLIDELDLHLHPIWQRQLVNFLSTALPNLQIICTSHSPMIAQQLRENELYVVERTSARAGSTIRAVVGDPSRLSLTQLMSPMFGIESTDSMRIQKLRQRAKTKNAKLTTEDRDELAQVVRETQLPEAMLQQVKTAEELTLAISKVAKIDHPKLDPERLRARIVSKIRLADA
jgi:predicted ATP-binding protein involved in virulence